MFVGWVVSVALVIGNLELGRSESNVLASDLVFVWEVLGVPDQGRPVRHRFVLVDLLCVESHLVDKRRRGRWHKF